jgi:hypothetical protein
MLSIANRNTIDSVSRSGGAFSIANSFVLDGVDEYFNIDSMISPLASTTKGTWLISLFITDATPSGNGSIIAFDDTSTKEDIMVFINTLGIINIIVRVANVGQWTLATTSAVFTDNTWHTLALVQDGVSPVVCIDGVAVPQGFTLDTNKSSWFNNSSGLDNGRIGCRNFNNAGNSLFSNIIINQVSFLDTDLSASQTLAWHNNNKPKNPQSLFGTSVKGFFNPDNSGSTAQFTITDSINSVTATSVNLEDVDKTTATPYI